jgi:hypothetical protein
MKAFARPVPRILAALLVVVALAGPARAGDIFTLKASGAQTTAGTGSLVEVGPWRLMTVTVNVTAGSGTVNPFRVWIEVTPDGTTWFELPCRLVLKTGATAPGAAAANQRDIVNETAVQTSAKYVGVCDLTGPQIRAAWNIAGSSPSETFSVTASAK